MKIFTKKGITQKIILAVILVTLCNFIFPTYSRADIGGILFSPISNLFVTIGDVIIGALQQFLYDNNIKSIFEDYTSISEMKYTRKKCGKH